MSKSQSAIQGVAGLFKHYEEQNTEVMNHILVGIDVDSAGRPISKVLKSQASPFEALGMIDLMIKMLEETREEIHDKLDEQDKISRLVSKLPGELGDKIKDMELRMRYASERMDKEEMMRIQAELDALIDNAKEDLGGLLRKLKGDKPGDSDTDFSAKDFLGGL